jgi:hypothetical protein
MSSSFNHVYGPMFYPLPAATAQQPPQRNPQPEHQDYLERYPNGYTCHFVRPQWKLRQQFLSSCSNSCQALVCLVGDDV